jgi:hydroxymethylpyrimidine pyrophosphatase-like HAD family hydrolase
MIRLASIGIAVGNAVASVQTVADIVMDDTSTDGAAGQAIELFGLGKVIELMGELKDV